jgi:hypothetical protein
MHVTKDSLIGEILFEFPQAQEIMLKYLGEEVACVMCPGQSFDTFAMIADLHGIDEEVVEEMLKEMNVMMKEVEQANPATSELDRPPRLA